MRSIGTVLPATRDVFARTLELNVNYGKAFNLRSISQGIVGNNELSVPVQARPRLIDGGKYEFWYCPDTPFSGSLQETKQAGEKAGYAAETLRTSLVPPLESAVIESDR